jgi:hypothetical protein
MATVFEDFATDGQRSVVLFCVQKNSVQRLFTKKSFLFRVISVSRLKRLTAGAKNIAKVSMMAKRLKRRCGNG